MIVAVTAERIWYGEPSPTQMWRGQCSTRYIQPVGGGGLHGVCNATDYGTGWWIHTATYHWRRDEVGGYDPPPPEAA